MGGLNNLAPHHSSSQISRQTLWLDVRINKRGRIRMRYIFLRL